MAVLGINRAAMVTLILAQRRLTDGAPKTPISPGSILAGRREAKPAARVQSPGAACDGAGILDAALGGGSLLTAGVSIGASLWTGLNRYPEKKRVHLQCLAREPCQRFPRRALPPKPPPIFDAS